MAGNTLRFKAVLEDKVSSNLARIRDNFDRLGGKGSGASLFGNVGAKTVAAGFGLIDRAASAVIDVLGQSVTAALEEEKSIAGLDASLRANVKGWDGNRAAIEHVLTARMRLGFSDDEQRTSLKLLVGATNDVNKALAMQRVAMDLARFKGIDLATASEALVKVEAGQYRMLKSLGIQLPKNATQEQALAAVMKVVTGAAEAQADTTGGKLLAAQIAVSESMEKLGTVLLPLVAAGATALTDALAEVSAFADEAGKHAKDFGEKVAFLGRLAELASLPFTLPFRTAAFAIGQVQESLKSVSEKAWEMAKPTDRALDSVARASYNWKEQVVKATDKIEVLGRALYKDFIPAVDAATGHLTEAVYGPAQFTGKLAELKQALSDDRAELKKLEAIKHPTLRQQRDIDILRGKIAATREDLLKTRIDFALLNGTGLNDLILELGRLSRTTGKAADQAQRLLVLRQLGHQGNLGGGGIGAGGGGRASGGPVTAGVPYWVGEKGRKELFVPGSNGAILTEQQVARRPVGGAAPPRVIHIHVDLDGKQVGQAIWREEAFVRSVDTFAPAAS